MRANAIEPGCWARVVSHGYAGRPALFLDRDGVLVEDVGYLRRVEDVAMAPGAAELVGRANAHGVPVIVVTNQSGVGRGLFGWREFEAVQEEIEGRLATRGGRLDAVFACAYHEAAQEPFAVAGHPWRKPNAGMLLAARERMGVDLARSAIVGDRAQDLAAGRAAGLRLGAHVATGHGGSPAEQAGALALARPDFQVRLAPSLTALLDLPALLAES